MINSFFAIGLCLMGQAQIDLPINFSFPAAPPLIQVEADVSNSRCEPHGYPLSSTIVLKSKGLNENGSESFHELFGSTVLIDGRYSTDPVCEEGIKGRLIKDKGGEACRLQLEFLHDHKGYIATPLLGIRHIVCKFDSVTFKEIVDLSQEVSLIDKPILEAMNKDAVYDGDREVLGEKPDYILNVSDNKYYCRIFGEVRPGSTVALRFDYVIAPGDQASPVLEQFPKYLVEVYQYNKSGRPNTWHRTIHLPHDMHYHWETYRALIPLEESAEEISMLFKISGGSAGTMYLKDVQVDYVGKEKLVK